MRALIIMNARLLCIVSLFSLPFHSSGTPLSWSLNKGNDNAVTKGAALPDMFVLLCLFEELCASVFALLAAKNRSEFLRRFHVEVVPARFCGKREHAFASHKKTRNIKRLAFR